MMLNGERTEIMKATDIRLPGIHNVENYLTAITAVYGEVDRENMVKWRGNSAVWSTGSSLCGNWTV